MQRRYEYRRKLPQFQPDHKVFFITFSTYKRRIFPEAVRQIVIETCLAGNGKKFRLYGVVVMPDHVHLVLSPLSDPNGSFSIAEIMQAIKGASAHRINRALRRKGKVWEEESFDRVLRRENAVKRLFFPNLPFAAQRTVDSMCRCALDRLHNLGNAERPIWIGER